MLTLYFAPGSSSMAPHIALNEIGVPFEARAVSFAAKGTRALEILALNPEGKVPILVIDGRPLTEVAAILFWLARRFPEASLLPANDIDAEAEAISWMSFAAATLHPARWQGGEVARKAFAIADRRLGTGAWAVGESYSIADIHLFRLFWRLRFAGQAPHGAYPNLDRHYAAMMARPAVQRTCAAEAAIGYELPA
jgi:glutathione S-transferase